MIRYSIQVGSLICFLCVGCTLAGCSDFKPKQKDNYFIKVGSKTITVTDFKKAFELAKNAYSQNRIQQPDIDREVRIQLIRQMIEEMILLQKAEELGITITDSQVEKALEDLKKDYPDNEFHETLLEYAVPYKSWREGLKTRLLMKKLINRELGDKIKITKDDISKYYAEHFKKDTASTDAEDVTGDDASADVKEVPKDKINIITNLLRKEKLEKAYASWINQLRDKYPVEINKKELAKMAG